MVFDNDKITHFGRDLLCIPQVHKEILKLSVGIQGKIWWPRVWNTWSFGILNTIN